MSQYKHPSIPGPSPLTLGSQGIHSQEQDELRFAELLKPIKDLTVNWEVPLARYLEEYIEELASLQLDLQSRSNSGVAHSVNFVEAALLLQGTISVYSKKVEFLWQNVLKLVDLLASRRALEEASEAIGGDGKGKRGKKGHDFNDFRVVGCELSRNVNIKSDQPIDAKARERKSSSLNFISVTPRQLIEKEGREVKNVTVNLYSIKGTKELLGHKEDFRINSQFALSLGTLGDELAYEFELGQLSVSLCEESNQTTANATGHTLEDDLVILNRTKSPEHQNLDVGSHSPVPEDPRLSPLPSPPLANDLEEDAHEAEPIVCDDNPNVNQSSDDVNQEEKSQEGDECAETDEPSLRRSKRIRRNKFEENLNEPKAPLNSQWEPIKPQEASNVVPDKPIRKGKTSRAPKNVVLKRTTAADRRQRKENALSDSGKQFVPPLEQCVSHKASHKYSNLSKNTQFETEFQDVALENATKKQEQKGKENLQPIPDVGDNNNNEAGDEDEGWEDFNYEGGFHDNASDDEPLLDEGTRAVEADKSNGDEGEVDSYEELVTRRVAAYVQQSQEYIESTDLAKRVSRWHEDIRPKLDKVEKRGNFDIHRYGNDIISTFPDGNVKSTVNFTEVVNGKDKEEVCRYFLSSLMLANAYNVELEHNVPDQSNSKTAEGANKSKKVCSRAEDLPMNHLELTLLSRKMHHEQLLEYIAPPKSSEALGSQKRLEESEATDEMRPRKRPKLKELQGDTVRKRKRITNRKDCNADDDDL